MKWIVNKNKISKIHKPIITGKTLFEVKSFHESFKEYEQTPLVRLKRLAEYLGISTTGGELPGWPDSWDNAIIYMPTDVFVSVPDWVAARGMRLLGNPLKGDTRVISGESGAVTTGFLSVVSAAEKYKELNTTT